MAGLIRVLEIPPPSGNFHFGGGERQAFTEVDWFRDDVHDMMETAKGRDAIADFIKGKRYFDVAKAYLVLHERHTFTIGYRAP
jgi:hypothetical protein